MKPWHIVEEQVYDTDDLREVPALLEGMVWADALIEPLQEVYFDENELKEGKRKYHVTVRVLKEE